MWCFFLPQLPLARTAEQHSLVDLLAGLLCCARKLRAQRALPAAAPAAPAAAALEFLAERGDDGVGGVPLVLQHKHKLQVASCMPGQGACADTT